ncbi:hypothetical protein BD410DRAFT_795296 [Rickenella mellea]|uniref:SAP domain-containing protein n=1 Tax=Rickenella mellea TaxID=50990 RepID=A0A4Y7PN39_9AGAM|nr:hypothetical protein BD410DRAFT_795296 [Rickenella mellea]
MAEPIINIVPPPLPGHAGPIEVLRLPILGQALVAGGTIAHEEFWISKTTTNEVLKQRLQAYNLPFSGNRKTMTNRLRDFSRDEGSWNSIFQAKRKRTRGDGAGTRGQSHSAKRTKSIFGEREIQTEFTTRHPHLPVAIRRTEAEIKEKDKLVVAFLSQAQSAPLPQANLTRQSHDPARELARDVDAEEASTGCTEQNPPPAVGIRKISRQVKNIDDKVDHVLHLLSRAQPLLGQTTPHQFTPVIIAQSNAEPTCSTRTPISQQFDNNTSMVLGNISNAGASRPEDSADDPSNMRTVHLGHEEFRYNVTKVPDPPATHFSDNIDGLFKNWHESKLLIVNGRGIAVKFWPEFYMRSKGSRTHAWDALKGEWGKWKYIADERDSCDSDEAFWLKFQDGNGKCLHYTAILDKLQKQRVEAIKQDSADALKFFGGDLSRVDARGAFMYSTRGQRQVMIKPEAIAKKWRTLLQDPEISRQWGELCSV